MVLTADGAQEPSDGSYDRKVAGIVSGGGSLRPGVILGAMASPRERVPFFYQDE